MNDFISVEHTEMESFQCDDQEDLIEIVDLKSVEHTEMESFQCDDQEDLIEIVDLKSVIENQMYLIQRVDHGDLIDIIDLKNHEAQMKMQLFDRDDDDQEDLEITTRIELTMGKRIVQTSGTDEETLAESDFGDTDSDNDVGNIASMSHLRLKGTTIVAIIGENNIILAADGMSIDEDGVLHDGNDKIYRVGKTVLCAIGGYVPHGIQILEELEKKVPKYEMEVNNCVVRSMTIFEVAASAYGCVKDLATKCKDYKEGEDFLLVLAGFDWSNEEQTASMAWASKDFFNKVGEPIGVEEIDAEINAAENLFWSSENDEAKEACRKVLVDGFEVLCLEKNEKQWIQKAEQLAKEAITEASSHCKVTGGKITVCRVSKDVGQKKKIHFYPKKSVEQVQRQLNAKRKSKEALLEEEQEELKEGDKKQKTDEVHPFDLG